MQGMEALDRSHKLHWQAAEAGAERSVAKLLSAKRTAARAGRLPCESAAFCQPS
jgi:hypothetical protein